jgi:hypothetical protein
MFSAQVSVQSPHRKITQKAVESSLIYSQHTDFVYLKYISNGELAIKIRILNFSDET